MPTVTYLNENSTTMAAGGWSNATGFENSAILVNNKPGGQSIQTAIDWSGLTQGIESYDQLAPFSGVVGGVTGPLKVDADYPNTGPGTNTVASGVGRIRVESGTLYYQAAGNSNVCYIAQVGRSGNLFCMGGALTNFHAYGGTYNVGDQTTFGSGTIRLAGGTGVIQTHSSDLWDTCVVTGGAHTIKRGATATTGVITITGGSVTLDLGTAAIPIIYLYGGTLNWISAAAPDANSLFLRGGIIDVSNVNTAVSINGYEDSPSCKIKGYGNPKFTLGGTRTPIGTGAEFIQ